GCARGLREGRHHSVGRVRGKGAKRGGARSRAGTERPGGLPNACRSVHLRAAEVRENARSSRLRGPKPETGWGGGGGGVGSAGWAGAAATVGRPCQRTPGEGSMTIHPHIPVLDLSGTPAQVGAAHGESQRQRVREHADRFLGWLLGCNAVSLTE